MYPSRRRSCCRAQRRLSSSSSSGRTPRQHRRRASTWPPQMALCPWASWKCPSRRAAARRERSPWRSTSRLRSRSPPRCTSCTFTPPARRPAPHTPPAAAPPLQRQRSGSRAALQPLAVQGRLAGCRPARRSCPPAWCPLAGSCRSPQTCFPAGRISLATGGLARPATRCLAVAGLRQLPACRR